MSENPVSFAAQPHYAGFWRRFIAALLDQVVLLVGRAFVYGAIGLIIYAMLFVFDARSQLDMVFRIYAGILVLADFWITWIYFAGMESSTLQGSLGKLAVGIRVCNADLKRVTFEQATARYFSKIISSLTIGVGYLLCAYSSKKQALHDLVAKTILIVR